MLKLFPHGLAGIIYDCDGVMIDSEEANRYFYNTILQALDLPRMTPEQERYAFMAASGQALQAMTPRKLWPRLEETARSVINYSRDVLPRTRLASGFREFAVAVHAAGLRQAVDTNRTEAGIQRVLDFFGLPNYFDPVISVSVAEPKPSPRGIELVCNQWNCAPDSILFIGDSLSDAQAARAAGCVFAAFGNEELECDLRVSGYRQLLEQINVENVCLRGDSKASPGQK